MAEAAIVADDEALNSTDTMHRKGRRGVKNT